MKTLLVTGGSGFVGKSILDAFGRRLLRPFAVDNVIIVARRASQLRQAAPELLGPDVELIDADVRSLDCLFAADAIIHAAASAAASSYRIDPGAERAIIEQGSANVLRLANAARHPVNVLFVSSGAVYGKQPADVPFLREDASLQRAQDPEKRTYAEAKRAAETLVREAARRGLSASIARCFAFVGPWLPRDRHFAIGNFLSQALARKTITVKAKHRVIRSYMYADDLVEWLMTICMNGSEHCPVFNVGSDEAIAIGDLASLIANMSGVPARVPVADPEMPPDRYVPDVSLAQRALGLRLRVPLRQALERTLQLSVRTNRSADESPIAENR